MRRRRRRSFWFVLVGTTAFLTVDPALFLVVAALGLSAVALAWAVMLARALLVEAFAGEQMDGATPTACPLRAWRDGNAGLSSSARQTPSDPAAFS